MEGLSATKKAGTINTQQQSIMAAKNEELSVGTYNCRGFTASMHDIEQLCAMYHIILLQETWLVKQTLDKMTDISDNHFACGTAEVDYTKGITSGRPYGGTAILWNKKLNANTFMNQDQSIIGLEVCLDSNSLNILNVYMPYCYDSNYDEYINYLSKISILCDEIASPNVFIVGDFNACPNNNFGELLSQFYLEHELKISDKIILPVDSFTYVSDTHGTCSWMDHVVSSKPAHDSIQNIAILHQFILSDHRLVAATIKTAALPQNILCENKTHHEKNMNWNNATQQQKPKYLQASKIWLSKIPLFEELT